MIENNTLPEAVFIVGGVFVDGKQQPVHSELFKKLVEFRDAGVKLYTVTNGTAKDGRQFQKLLTKQHNADQTIFEEPITNKTLGFSADSPQLWWYAQNNLEHVLTRCILLSNKTEILDTADNCGVQTASIRSLGLSQPALRRFENACVKASI